MSGNCHKCEKPTGGAKFCPNPACGELQQNIQIERKAPASSFQKEQGKKKKDFFEQEIKKAAPTKVEKKKTWAQTNTGGDHYGQGKYKGKTTINFKEPPPQKKSINDLP